MEHNTSRYQRGCLYRSQYKAKDGRKVKGAWFVKYGVIENGERVQHNEKVCDGDKTKSYARTEADKIMVRVNAQAADPSTQEAGTTIAAFWETTYWPFVKETCKHSTSLGYKQVWTQHLEKHFGTMTLREYRKGTGYVFLTNLRQENGEPYSMRTLQHIKNLASGIFTEAAKRDLIDVNPWQYVDLSKVKTKAKTETQHYTLEEIENIINALVDHVDCQLIMALTYFNGLRKGEVQGLKWADVDADWLHIRRAVTRGHIDTPKTDASERSVYLIDTVKLYLLLWRAKCKPSQVWMFQNERGNPVCLKDTAVRTIRPVLAKAGLKWKGYHSGRRGHGTILFNVSGNSKAGRASMGHEDERVSKLFYEKMSREDQVQGMNLLQEEVSKRRKLLEAIPQQ